MVHHHVQGQVPVVGRNFNGQIISVLVLLGGLGHEGFGRVARVVIHHREGEIVAALDRYYLDRTRGLLGVGAQLIPCESQCASCIVRAHLLLAAYAVYLLPVDAPHLLKDSQETTSDNFFTKHLRLLTMVNLGHEGEIERRVLVELVLRNEPTHDMLQVLDLEPTDCLPIDHLKYREFFEALVKAILKQVFKNVDPKLIALEEVIRVVIRAHHHHAEVVAFKARVNVQHKLFRATRDADWGPSFSLVQLGHGPDVGKKQVDIYIRNVSRLEKAHLPCGFI